MPLKEDKTEFFLVTMFGFIWKQPIHQTLRQMRFVHILLLCSSQFILWEIVKRLENLDPTQAAIAYGAIAAVLIPVIWKSLDGLHKKTEADER